MQPLAKIGLELFVVGFEMPVPAKKKKPDTVSFRLNVLTPSLALSLRGSSDEERLGAYIPVPGSLDRFQLKAFKGAVECEAAVLPYMPEGARIEMRTGLLSKRVVETFDLAEVVQAAVDAPPGQPSPLVRVRGMTTEGFEVGMTGRIIFDDGAYDGAVDEVEQCEHGEVLSAKFSATIQTSDRGAGFAHNRNKALKGLEPTSLQVKRSALLWLSKVAHLVDVISIADGVNVNDIAASFVNAWLFVTEITFRLKRTAGAVAPVPASLFNSAGFVGQVGLHVRVDGVDLKQAAERLFITLSTPGVSAFGKTAATTFETFEAMRPLLLDGVQGRTAVGEKFPPIPTVPQVLRVVVQKRGKIVPSGGDVLGTFELKPLDHISRAHIGSATPSIRLESDDGFGSSINVTLLHAESDPRDVSKEKLRESLRALGAGSFNVVTFGHAFYSSDLKSRTGWTSKVNDQSDVVLGCARASAAAKAWIRKAGSSVKVLHVSNTFTGCDVGSERSRLNQIWAESTVYFQVEDSAGKGEDLFDFDAKSPGRTSFRSKSPKRPSPAPDATTSPSDDSWLDATTSPSNDSWSGWFNDL